MSPNSARRTPSRMTPPRAPRPPAWRARCARTALLAAAFAGGSGCMQRGDVDLLEARLREQQDQLYQVQQELGRVSSDLALARQESSALRQQMAAQGQNPLTPEAAEVFFTASGIQFHGLLTGGRNRDGQPGDESVSAILIPHDAAGDLVKLPGAIEIEAFDLSRTGDQQRIGRWEYDAEQSRGLWHSGFLSSGYRFDLTFDAPPQASEVLLHGRLTTEDGRQFDATQTVKVTPAAVLPGDIARPLVQQVSATRAEDALPLGKELEALHGTGRTARKAASDPHVPTGPLPPTGRNTAPSPPGESPPTRATLTSDSWTDDTIPYLR